MKYRKPVVVTPESVGLAKCGSGPSGRPCNNRA